MRRFHALAALGAAMLAVPAHAACDSAPPPAKGGEGAPIVPGYEPGPETPPSPLVELAADSLWRARFAAAADELLPALLSGDAARWQPLLGGPWLNEADRAKVSALLADQCGPFIPLVQATRPPARRIFGWSVPSTYSPADRAEIAARPEAEALVCWSAQPPGEASWPQTAVEADNARGRTYACARIVYSVRERPPKWRAFIEAPA